MASILGTAQSRAREYNDAVDYAAAHGGLLPADPFWKYVEARYDQAIATGHLARFDFYHPRIAPLLAANLAAERPPPPMIPPVIPPVTTPVPPPATLVPPPVGTPGTVPEPPAALLLGVGLVLAALGMIVTRWALEVGDET